MDGATPRSQTYVDTVDLAYVVKGVADLDANGKADIVFHHQTLGEVWVWPMNGATGCRRTGWGRCRTPATRSSACGPHGRRQGRPALAPRHSR